MLLFLPWIFMLVAIVGVILLWDDYFRETRYNEFQEETEWIDEEKEGMMVYEPENFARRHHKTRRRRYRKCS